MATLAAADQLDHHAELAAYDRFAGVCALLAAAIGFLYSVAFVVLRSDLLSALCLCLVGLLGCAIIVGLYQTLRATDAAFALLALLLGAVGALGSAIHGAYDLANALHPPATALNPDLPSQIDPRGLLTFGLLGLALWISAWLIVRGGLLPRSLGYLGYLNAALLVILYLARLIVLDATSPLVLVPALLAGFITSPLWYAYLGVSFWRRERAA